MEINPLVFYHVNMPANILSRIYNDRIQIVYMVGQIKLGVSHLSGPAKYEFSAVKLLVEFPATHTK